MLNQHATTLKWLLFNTIISIMVYLGYHYGIQDYALANDEFFITRFGCCAILFYVFHAMFITGRDAIILDSCHFDSVFDLKKTVHKLEKSFRTCSRYANWCSSWGLVGTAVGFLAATHTIGAMNFEDISLVDFTSGISGALTTTIMGLVCRIYITTMLHMNELKLKDMQHEHRVPNRD